MLFNSLHFFVFLPIVVALHFALRAKSHRKWWLLAASYYFYMVFSVPLVGLLMWSTFVDYVVAQRIDSSSDVRKRKRWVVISAVSNLGLLFLFKYFNLFAWSLASLVGVDGQLWTLSALVLPMGISFYTFQTMSYTIDVYRGKIPASSSVLDVALYVAFFPQLVAGPIVRGETFMPQLNDEHRVDRDRMRSGAVLIAWGLCKKTMIADPMGRIVDQVYGPNVAPWIAGAEVSTTSTHPTCPLRCKSSGDVGTYRYPHGCATTSTYRWAETAKDRCGHASIWR